VEKIIVECGQAKGIRLRSGEEIMADEVVINADFAYAMSQLVDQDHLRKYRREKLEKKQYSCSTFMLYLGVNKQYDLAHHNIYFAKSYKENVEAIFNQKTLVDDTSLYVQNASVTDPTLAPAGKSAIYILVPVANNFSGIDWDHQKEMYKEKVLDIVTKRVPQLADLRDHIEVEKMITPADWEGTYHVYKGATFNLAHNLSQMLYFRPRNRFEELENCYLVGGGTHPGSGLPTIYESARITANLLAKKYDISYRKPSPLPEKEMVDGIPAGQFFGSLVPEKDTKKVE
jgi:phytoene desaturase